MNENMINAVLENLNSLPPHTDRNFQNQTEITENTNPKFSLDTLSEKSIKMLGFELYFDDIILIALILFLMQEEKKDYLLIGVLGLMLFDFSIENLTNFEPLKNLLNNIT